MHYSWTTLGNHEKSKPQTKTLPPPPSTQDIPIPFSQSRHLAFNIPVNPQGKIDIYMDDCITVIPDIVNNRSRVNAAMPLTIHSVSRTLSQKEPVPIDEMIDP